MERKSEGKRTEVRELGREGKETNDEAWQSHRRVPAWLQNDTGLVSNTKDI